MAIDGVGVLLEGAPGRLAYQVGQAPIYGQRFASGDRDYTDFSFWWYWAQTDFSGGYKSEPRWADDAKYYLSEGVDTSEQPGSVVLAHSVGTLVTVAKNVIYTDYGEVNNIGVVVGRNVTDQKMRITQVVGGTLGSALWEDSATGANEKINCCASFGGNNSLYLGCATVGSGASTLKVTTGGAPTDIGTLANEVYAIVPHLDGDANYVFNSGGIHKHDRAAGTVTNVKSSFPLGQASTAFSFGVLNGKGAWLSGDRIYFLMYADGYSHLMAYDISDNAYVRIFTFPRGLAPTRIIERNGSIYTFGQNKLTDHMEIWKYVSGSGAMGMLHEIGRGGEFYNIIASPVLDVKNIYFILNDGTSDYEVWGIDNADALHASWGPSATLASTANFLGCVRGGYLVIGRDGASGTNRLEVGDPNTGGNFRQANGFITTSIFDGGIPAIDKLFNSVTINFSPFTDSSQSITIESSTDEGLNWTTLGAASHALDGATVTSKRLFFGTAVLAKTLMLRFTHTGSGVSPTSTPYLNAFSVQYVPFTDYAKNWSININCGTSLRDLSGSLVETTGRELRGRLERAWLTKSLLDFQDVDFSSTQLDGVLSVSNTTITVDSTVDFPEQGRLRIENEEILYTGKTQNTFTGCVRGARGTLAVSHAEDVVVSNAYRVIITDMNQAIPVLLDGKWTEHIVGLSVREA